MDTSFQRLTLNKIYFVKKKDDNSCPETEEIVFASFDKEKAEAKLEELEPKEVWGFGNWCINYSLEEFDVS